MNPQAGLIDCKPLADDERRQLERWYPPSAQGQPLTWTPPPPMPPPPEKR